MKILETNYDYELMASNQVAHFKNELLAKIWRYLPANIDREDYYVINRSVSEVVDSMIGILSCSYEVDARYVIRADLPDDYFVHHIASQLSEAIVKSDIAYISKRNALHGGNRYVVSIPFIKTTLRQNPEPDTQKGGGDE